MPTLKAKLIGWLDEEVWLDLVLEQDDGSAEQLSGMLPFSSIDQAHIFVRHAAEQLWLRVRDDVEIDADELM
ncbi:hypothetical protein [Enterovirga sp. CN4-39]|uniref:hypothetical protein n=1 Tax=Enterovirga sp. CN4-39 TaxID=3400910 RepID=UPI003C087ECD